VTYFEFLGAWYNLVFLGLGGAGLFLAAWGRLRNRDPIRPAATLLIAAVAGLTWNGAIHDLGLGSPASRFPWVLIGSVAIGWAAGRWLWRFRRRHFRAITAVQFNRPGHEGAEARLVTRDTGPEPGSGRAQWQDEDGTLHIVHAHTVSGGMGFGQRVRLERFDEDSESYLVSLIPRRRRRSSE
jgi:hypothetical protein